MTEARSVASIGLLAALFVIGFALMGFEMLGSRYLNPYFGGGITTWACLISVVLFAMMVGYFAGGYAVDAYPGVEWKGKVESLSPATGAEFSILPPQNATGNWVKVVQRLPVRLAVEPDPAKPPLRMGMSAIVSIDTGERGAAAQTPQQKKK